jgi:hypothetical protein
VTLDVRAQALLSQTEEAISFEHPRAGRVSLCASRACIVRPKSSAGHITQDVT